MAGSGASGSISPAATEMAAWERPLDEILQEAQEHWTLQKPTSPCG